MSVEFPPGALLGQYRIECRLGAGGMGAVYRARDEVLGRTVAVKVLLPAMAEDQGNRERFVREALAASAVDHPHIIPVYTAGHDKGTPYLAMRFVEGGDLGSFVSGDEATGKQGTGPMEPGQAMALLSPLASALDAAHGAGILHRDVKPGNILLDRSPGRFVHPYLSDFGLAECAGLPRITDTGRALGTPSFAAPEQLNGERAGPAADEFALACVAFYVLTAELPFRGHDLVSTLWARMSGPPARVTGLRPDLPAAVDEVMAKALALDPAKRYLSCHEFTTALHDAISLDIAVPGHALAHESPPEIAKSSVWVGATLRSPAVRPDTPPDDTRWRHARPRPRRLRRRWVAIGAAIVALAAGTAAYSALNTGTGLPQPAGSWKLAGRSTADSSQGNHPVAGGRAAWCPDGNCAWFPDGQEGMQRTTSAPVVNTSAGSGFAVSASVDLDSIPPKGAFATAISQDGAQTPTGDASGFFLQYDAADKSWAFAAYLGRAHGGSVRPGQWVHLTGVYDGSSNTATLYVNGTQAGIERDISPLPSNGPLAIGRAQYNGKQTDWWYGGIKNVEVFDQALTPAQVRLLYQRNST